MKKRMFCVMLTLIMLFSLLPVSASAAGKAISESGITVLKQLQLYLGDECVACGTEYRIGYGTVCTEKNGTHGVTDGHPTYNEGKANAALREKLKELDAAVNAFAANNNLTLTQNQHDALVIFSYDMGTAWLSGNGVLKTAIVKGTTGNAFLNAIGQSADYGGDPSDKVTGYERRMIEGNLYLNGIYSDVKPNGYAWVKYQINRNQETMAEANAAGEYIQYFDAYTMTVPQPVPTRGGYTFLGWYQDGKTWVDRLWLYQVSGKTLTPLWQKYGTTWQTAVSGLYTMIPVSNLSTTALFNNPGDKIATGKYVVGTHATVDADFIDATGARWSRMKDGSGWVLVKGTASSSAAEIDVTVTVTNDFVRRRANASITSKDLGRYNKGEQLRIINTENGSNLLWGQVADANGTPVCWIALMYTNWNAVKDNASSNTDATKAVATAVISCNGYLNVRNTAGTDGTIVGALANGDVVDIYELDFVNGHQWGRTSSGWIQLTYCKVTMLTTDVDNGISKDVLAYSFTGKTKAAVTARKDATVLSDEVGKSIPAGTAVVVTMLKKIDNVIWGFNGTGWIKLDNITMDEAKYVVISDNAVSVRTAPSTGSARVDSVTKGVELNISQIDVVDATIWGYSAKYNGWVNLASKYVTRSNAPVIENTTGNTLSNLIATIVNTDSVNVRVTSSAQSTQIGKLSRGTSVRCWFDNNGEGTWYKIDSNRNGVFDENGDGWVSASYLSIDVDTPAADSSTSTGTTGDSAAPTVVETGMGIVANTYSGVNIRQGAGTGYAAVGKYLNGTSIEILEVTPTATTKWGRTAKGWVCMDYVTMISKYPVGDAAVTPTQPASPNPGGSSSETKGNVTISSTPANYTGIAVADVDILKTYDVDSLTAGESGIVSKLYAGQSISIYELVKVTQKITISGGDMVDGNPNEVVETTTYRTTYWARVNGGWIQDPATNLSLNVLDETTYTVSKATNLHDAPGGLVISSDPIAKNTQVVVTQVQIVEDKVWGKLEDVGTSGGWVRLDNLTQGAINITEPTSAPPVTAPDPMQNMGNGSDQGGFVGNTTGYRYTGKVINCNELNVRAGASTAYNTTAKLKAGANLVIYETVIADSMAWGRCDAGWVYLYYVDLMPVTGGVDARVVYNENTVIYSDMNCSSVVGTYAKMSVIDILEVVGNMSRTNQGWVKSTDLL